MRSWKEFILVLTCCAALAVYLKPATDEVPGSEQVVVTNELGTGKNRLVLVRLDQDPKLVQWSQQQIEQFTGAQVSRVVDLSSQEVMSDSYNATRGMCDGDTIAAFLHGMSHSPDERLLAVTSIDLYLSSQPNWTSSFGTEGDDFAVLSTREMESGFKSGKGLSPARFPRIASAKCCYEVS